MSDIKMIVTDMDGTFLNSKKEMHPEAFDIIRKLNDKGIIFVVASGRQYFNLYNRFNNDNIIYLAENGCLIVKGSEIFRFKSIGFGIILEILEKIKTINNTQVILSGKKAAYTKPFISDEVEKHFREYYSKIVVVDDYKDIDDDICKIAILNLNGTEDNVYPLLAKYSFDYSITVSSFEWLDIFDITVNKGASLETLQQRLNISKEETMIFGDYLNDLELYNVAKETYAMENAHPKIKEAAKYIAPSNDEFGVIKVIKEKFNL